MNLDPDLCPFCEGVRVSLNYGARGHFTTTLHSEYLSWMEGAMTERFRGWIYACAACYGTGRADVAAARVLDGTLDAIRADIKRRNTSSVFIDGSFGGL